MADLDELFEVVQKQERFAYLVAARVTDYQNKTAQPLAIHTAAGQFQTFEEEQLMFADRVAQRVHQALTQQTSE
jgi:hypothetical protein